MPVTPEVQARPEWPFRLLRAASRWLGIVWVAAIIVATTPAAAQYPSGPQIFKDGTTVALQDYASVPLSSRTTSSYPPPINFSDQLSRINFLRSEPTNAPLSMSRFFVNDLNRNLYILDKASKTFTTYINFEVVFPKFINGTGLAGGLVTFAFDPGYATNHKFYTVHTENPAKSGSSMPTNGALPGLDLTGYTTNAPFNPPSGSSVREAVLIEWTDSNITNTTFEGTARELLRIGFNQVIHPIGDLIFNPLAHPGEPDYGNLYIAVGDGAAGESVATHTTPQRLDALQGKILRITPDITLRPSDQLSSNGRYRIPTTGTDTNPFVSVNLSGLKKEIFAYGFRNAHRLSWDRDSNLLIENDIGLNSWEEVNFISKGANYGYAEREGIEQLFVGGANNGLTGGQTTPITPFPSPDTLVVTGLVSTVTPVYPVAAYTHRDGDAITSGFVYRGTLMPGMRGKYLFGDITTGRLFYCNLGEMIAANNGSRTNLAPIHELQIVFNGAERRFFDVVADGFAAKGGTLSPGNVLPGGCGGLKTAGNDPYGVPYGCGRADIRLAEGGDGEIYVLSKSDGMIRKMMALLSPPTIQSIQLTNGLLNLSWSAVSNHKYQVQFNTTLTSTNWMGLAGAITATNSSASTTDSVAHITRFYKVLQVQ